MTPQTTDALTQASRAVILAGQAPSGAYVASPAFSQYGYCWLRDGSFVAMAMAAVGERDSAHRFHQWAAAAISAQRERAEAVIRDLEAGVPVPPERMLPTRYRLSGEEESGAKQWPNFQLDGYGTWLFALHSFYGEAATEDWRDLVRLVARYLTASWRLPCYDYWEEAGDQRHTTTAAAIAAGLRAAARLLHDPAIDQTADEVMAFIREECLADGAFVKGPADRRVDSSLLSLGVPFGLVPLDDPYFIRTVSRIRSELSSPTGGIRRYLGDSYYGGSPWTLLTAWLGWRDRLAGATDEHRREVAWVREAAGPTGTLPEQVVGEPQFPDYVPVWEERWGPVADPLLWSHAKYLLALHGGEPASWG